MSVIIQDFVVHQLRLNDNQELCLVPRERCFDISPAIEALADQVHATFNAKPGKGVGALDDADHPQFAESLRAWLSGEESFYGFSVQAAELLQKTLIDFATLETGFLLLCRYQFLATDFLMIALLNTKQHVEINQHLELSYRDHLDLSRMQLAVRIDLTDLRIAEDKKRYVSFIKGRAGRKVSDFFLAFLGCNELLDIKQQNRQLVSAVNDFLASEQLDPQEKQQSREQVASYYKEKLEQGEDIDVKELSTRITHAAGSDQDFYAFISAEQPVLEDKFQADKAVLKELSKFSGQGGGVALSFDRALFGDRVQYDAGTDTLTIRGIPPNLKDQLLRHKGQI